jgi:acyl-CoA thioester hydrolase
MQQTEFPYQIEIDVIFRDLDALGHVNNAVYFTYMEVARTRFFMELLNIDTPEQLAVIVAEATCTFRAPAFFGERLTVGLGISRFGHKSFDIVYKIQTRDGRLVATAKTVMVAYDYGRQQTIPISDDLRAKLENYAASSQ